jgi:DNA repair exonuclease SbcCD nuclease subunit
MKIAIITDQHFGARKNSKLFHDYFLKFYNDVFFPTLEAEGITTIVDMGDTFDSRKGIDFSALSWAKNNYYDKLKDYTIHTIVGNHTAYYKNTNEVNAIDLLLREYKNVKIYSEATEIKIDNLGVLLVPWINSENEEHTIKCLKKSKCPVVMGHLELNGFIVTQQVVMDHGFDMKYFKKFDRVYSGHFHKRSNQGEIYYLGNPYEIYWNDFEETRGFHIFDTETLEHTSVNNPYRLFYKIFYNDTPYQTFDVREYEGKIVKLIVRKKTDTKKFEKFVDKLYSSNVAELKIVENFEFNGWYDDSDSEVYESEDTMSILNRYIEESEVNLDKSVIQKMMQEVYQEACELV